jgi:Tol biopolymer transport system component
MTARPHALRSRLSVAALAAALSLTIAATTAAQSPTDPALPGLVPGEPWIAYQDSAPEGRYGVHLVRPDGTGAFFALAGIHGATSPDAEQLHPEWSPDGHSILVDVQTTDGTYEIWVADTTDWSAHRIVECAPPCLWVNEPAWSPDGSRVAFQRHVASEGGEISSIEILDLAGGDISVVYATTDVGLFAPRWSPDGNAIVMEMPSFEGGILTGDSLGVLDLTTSPATLREIVPPDKLANNPDWSHDGTLIAFSAPGPGGDPGGDHSDLWLVAPDGSGLRQLTAVGSTGTAVQPTFLPDDSGVLFKLTEPSLGAANAMAVVSLDGSDLRSVVDNGYRYGWHPRMRPTP